MGAAALTKGCLKRPVTVLVSLIALVIFAVLSISSITLKLMPDIDYPVLAPGSTGIALGTGISRVMITPRWWEL